MEGDDLCLGRNKKRKREGIVSWGSMTKTFKKGGGGGEEQRRERAQIRKGGILFRAWSFIMLCSLNCSGGRVAPCPEYIFQCLSLFVLKL